MSRYWQEIEEADDLRTPKGFVRIEGLVYVGRGQVVVVGDPPNCEEEESAHNCDEMGCSTFSHVLVRGKVTEPWEEAEVAQPRSEDRCEATTSRMTGKFTDETMQCEWPKGHEYDHQGHWPSEGSLKRWVQTTAPGPEEPKELDAGCPDCSAQLKIKETAIWCDECGCEWGLVNGHWVEVPKDQPQPEPKMRSMTPEERKEYRKVIRRLSQPQPEPAPLATYLYFKPGGKWKYDGEGATIPIDGKTLTHARIRELNNGSMPGITGSAEEFTVVILDPTSFPRMIPSKEK